MIIDYFILFFSWAVYFFLHSALASNEVKEMARKTIISADRHFRLLYSFISIAGLVFLGWIISDIPSKQLFSMSGWNRVIGMLVGMTGIFVAVFAFAPYSIKGFLGFSDEKQSNELITTGLNGSVRHPLYSATILIVIGAFLFIPTDVMLINALCIFAYLPIGIHFEEKKLIEIYGDRYRQYKKNVPAVLPRP